MSRPMDLPEQDVGAGDGDGLPTYEHLAQAHGPNSRFGRWRSWIEKRAAERYADTTPEELERRRQKGWGPSIEGDAVPQDGPSTPGPSTAIPTLQLDTHPDILPSPPIQPEELLEYDPSQPIVGESLRPAHLGLHQLGSRFLPHTTSPIRALLPLLGNRLLLIGHDDGLSVLNMFPQEWSDIGLQTRGPGEAEAHAIWTGEGVFQMSLLEVEEIGESSPQGVVLFLVGSDSENGKEQESNRILRMYNLASLISLAKWSISNKGARPLNLHRPPGWHPHRSTSKKNRPSGNIAKGLRSLMSDAPQSSESSSSYQAMLQVPSGLSQTTEFRRSTQVHQAAIDSGWDIVEDLPLRWATDYVPLAVPGSRLMNTSVLTYALWRNDDQPRGSALLAVAIKSAVLLYESPKSERAFRFVKEFYTPLLPRGISFVYQGLQDNLSRSISDGTCALRPSSQHAHAGRDRGSRHSMRQRPASSLMTTTVLDPQLSLFVVFEKKVGLIRIVNSAVGEVALFEEPAAHSPRDSSSSLSPSFASSSSSLSPTGLASLSGRRSRTSLDGFGIMKDNRGAWTLPAKLDLPTASSATAVDAWDTSTTLVGSAAATGAYLPEDSPTAERAQINSGGGGGGSIYIVTRGKQSFALPCPLPANLQSTAPLLALSWRSQPTFVAPRVIDIDIDYGGGAGRSEASDSPATSRSTPTPTSTPTAARRRVLQLTAFGEDGLEIQETPLSSLFGNGKERSLRAEDPVVSEVDIGETGFLCGGGHWHRPYDAPLDLSRSYSMRSGVSFDSLASEEIVARLESDQGIYAWQRKGLEDWRVLWIGGAGDESRTDDD